MLPYVQNILPTNQQDPCHLNWLGLQHLFMVSKIMHLMNLTNGLNMPHPP
jgi:hypothetical protein